MSSIWKFIRNLPFAVKLLMGLCILSFIVFGTLSPIPEFVRKQLLLRPDQAFGPKPWQILTATLSLTSPLRFVYMLLTLTWLGVGIEYALGTWRFLRVLALSCLGGTLIATLLGFFLSPTSTIFLDGTAMGVSIFILAAHIWKHERVTIFSYEQNFSARSVLLIFAAIPLVICALQRLWPELASGVTAAAISHGICAWYSRIPKAKQKPKPRHLTVIHR